MNKRCDYCGEYPIKDEYSYTHYACGRIIFNTSDSTYNTIERCKHNIENHSCFVDEYTYKDRFVLWGAY